MDELEYMKRSLKNAVENALNEPEDEKEKRAPRQYHVAGPRKQEYDEVTIKTIPRFKTSSLSGNEWRISACTELKYKGVVVKTQDYGDVKTALELLPVLLHSFDYSQAGDAKRRQIEAKYELLCDQEGCAELAVTKLAYKEVACTKCGSGDAFQDEKRWDSNRVSYRAFCPRHLDRGDASYNDSNECYTYLSGEPLENKRPRKEDESKAATVFL